LRKFVEQQLEEKDKKIMFLKKQLKEEKTIRNQTEEERGELRTHWMQTNTELEALKTNFNDCQEKADMSSRTQAELKSQIEQYEMLYKKHVMLESELVEAKAKEKAVGVFKTNLDNKKNEINLLEKKLNGKKKSQGKTFGREERTARVS
jgi:predicted RNase H-like nuclease (RuvC/YqgF family)